MGAFIDIRSEDGFVFPAYVAKPQGQARGGMVVIQEIFGVNAHIRAVADGYAADGYLAIAPAVFERAQKDVELGYSAEDMPIGRKLKAAIEALPAPGVQADIQACINYAAQAGKVGIVGYCWGGLLTWRSACLANGLSAAVCYYGGGMTTEAEIARQPKVSVMAHFSDRDEHISMPSVEAFAKAHPEVQLHMYSADHGFNCDHRGAYQAQSAALAKQRTLEFLAKHLG